MTPIDLMDALKRRVEAVTAGYRFRESDGGGLRAPRVWTQHLPEKLFDGEVDPADYPFIQIVIGGGSVSENGDGSCQVAILVGGYDDGQPVDPDDPDSPRDRQGWLIPAEIMWRVIADLEVMPLVGGQFQLEHPLTWELPQEQPAPMWYGLINAAFSMPVPQRGYGMDQWTQQPTVPRDGPYTEEIRT